MGAEEDFDKDALADILSSITPEEAEVSLPKTVPLTVYFDGVQKIVGTATVVQGKVQAYIHKGDGDEIRALVAEGVIGSVSVNFTIKPPAHPTLEFGDVPEARFMQVPHWRLGAESPEYLGELNEDQIKGLGFTPSEENQLRPSLRKYVVEETEPVKNAKIKGLTVTHAVVDEIAHTEEPWKDKFPYGNG